VPVYAWRRMGYRGTAPLILNVGARWRWVTKVTSQPLCPPRSMEQQAEWSSELVWALWRRGQYVVRAGIRIPYRQGRRPVTIQTELPRPNVVFIYCKMAVLCSCWQTVPVSSCTNELWLYSASRQLAYVCNCFKFV